MKPRIAAIVVAAGASERFGAPKILTPIAGIPAIKRAVSPFLACDQIDQVVIVTQDQFLPVIKLIFDDRDHEPHVSIVPGGDLRQKSVLAGLTSATAADIVVVHDAARPLLKPEDISAVLAPVLAGADAAFLALPVVDTIKRVANGGIETVDRSDLFRAQTPQAFHRADLQNALEAAASSGQIVTDEISLIEWAGGRVEIVAGHERLMKITHPEDAMLLNAIAEHDAATITTYRTGIGYDIHQLVADRPLVLGGVRVAHPLGLDGHSDADVLLHAISDAILGAWALGDIGQHFPPSDQRYENLDSRRILEHARMLVQAAGAEIVSVDATLLAEAPRIAPYIPAMQVAIGESLGLAPARIGVKATTNEQLGAIGRGEGLAALAIATLRGPA